jgi:hypothetical protein
MYSLPIARPNAFHSRPLLLLCAGELVSTAGSALTTLAASLLIYRLTGSALQVSLLLVAAALPSLLVGLLAGVFVDRLDRKRILIAADLGRAVLSLALPWLVGRGSFWLYAVVFLSSALGQFFNPAHESILADVAGERERTAANSLMALSGFGATTLGFAAGGLIASRFPLEVAFYLDGLTFLFSAACLWRIRVAPLAAAPGGPALARRSLGSLAADLRAGARCLAQNAGLRTLLLVSAPVVLAFGLWNSLLLPFTLRSLHATSFEYGLQEGLTALGFTAGCLAVMRLGGRLRPLRWILFSLLGLGTVGIYYALSVDIRLAIGLVALSGLLNAPYAVARRLLIQGCTRRETRGRVNSLFLVTRDLAYLAGMAAAGLADALDIRLLLGASGVLLLAAGVALVCLEGKPARVKVGQAT